MLHFFQTRQVVPECPPEPLVASSKYEETFSDGREFDLESRLPQATFILTLQHHMEAARKVKRYLDDRGFKNVQVWLGVDGSKAFNSSEYKFKNSRDPFTGKKRLVPVQWRDPQRPGVTTHRGKNDGFVTIGERGLLESFRSVFENVALKPEWKTFMVLEYDVVFHCEFMSKLEKVLRCPRCSNFIAPSAKKGGILMLGNMIFEVKNRSTPWSEYGEWPSVEEDIKQRASENPGSDVLCFNTPYCAFGGFAIIYHRTILPQLLSFFELEVKRPYDHIFWYLSDLNIIVRSAIPYLAIADIVHPSDVDVSRSKGVETVLTMHRWNTSDYCDFDSAQSFYKAKYSL